MTDIRVWAETETTRASFVIDTYPTDEALQRWFLTASFPGLKGAAWYAEEDEPRR